ncbi:MAG: patatin-like phospholipase family protein [Pseudomonadales bacterium]|nr:patatin-like phospholipase family protein [Pseudomonadales bacterium]
MSEGNSSAELNSGQALVLSGGGARAAYQVGCLRALSQALPNYRPQILTGVSAGAINATHLAAFQGSWQDSVEALVGLWQHMRTDKVYRTGLGPMMGRMAHWGLHFVSGGRLGRKDIRGMVQNAPLRSYLQEHLAADPATGEICGVDQNLTDGWLKALAVMTTNYASGRSEAWVDTLEETIWSGSQVSARPTSLTIDHVMASAALPFFFPAVRLRNHWHGDGGVRLAAPLSPALRLGAKRILAVSPRVKPQRPEEGLATSYPSPGQVAGVMLNAVFLDLLDFDALQMQRINDLLRRIPQQNWGNQRQVDVMVLRPQQDLGQIARQSQPEMPGAFRFFAGGFGGSDEPTADALSMVNFEPGYVGQLIAFGEQDTHERMDEIEAFLRGQDA